MTNAQILDKADWVLEQGVLYGRGRWQDFEITRWFRKGPFYLHSFDESIEFTTLDEALLAAGWTTDHVKYELRGDGVPSLALVAQPGAVGV